MQRWQIKSNKSVWLCKECMKKLSNVIMFGSWKWMEESKDISICCDKCKCNEHTVRRYGRLRRLFRYFTQSHLKYETKLKAYRRAIY